ncbi:MAG: hypothetical protein K0R08_992 [Solimicrobium sp.]|jgi:uncharacterized ferritin-like protein (DUF455 family)|nr:hypothetical protein [Solimicrobium sp.]
MKNELRSSALCVLGMTDPVQKVTLTQVLFEQQSGQINLDAYQQLTEQTGLELPGRPAKPELVSPLKVEHRTMHTSVGHAISLHALCHIEFNAINLALDAIWRFPGMPVDYYLDWLKVAAEEATHFTLLSEHLTTLGYAYGDFSGHNGLWEMVAKTKDNVLARMALVPRTLEARGLDAAPRTRSKLLQAGDKAGAAIIDIILRDEIGHVAIGNRWFGYLCQQRDLDPISCYANLAATYSAPKLRGPFNLAARRAAGFSESELQILLDAI